MEASQKPRLQSSNTQGPVETFAVLHKAQNHATWRAPGRNLYLLDSHDPHSYENREEEINYVYTIFLVLAPLLLLV